MRIGIAVVFAGLACAGAVSAQAQATRQLGPHLHGASHLTIAVDGRNLQMELRAPGADVVGFEFAPTTPQQRAAVAAATAALSDPIALFGIPAAAACTIGKVQVSIVEEDEDAGDKAAAAAAAPAPPPPASPPAATAARPATPPAPAPAAAKHNEFQATYQLTCANLPAITALNVAFFARFKSATDLDIDVVTARGAFELEATRAKPSVSTRNMF